MATGGKLEVQIGADITDFEKKIKEVEFDIKELSKVKLEKIKLGLDTREINAQIKDAKSSLSGLKTAIKDTGGQISGQFTKQVGNGNNALMQFSRIAQDAPYGMVGIQNNLTATAEAFSYLKNSTGSTSGALKAMASSLMGTGGILLGVSLLTTGLTLLSQSGLSVGDIIDKITGKFDEFGSAIKTASEEAVKSTAGEIFGLKSLVAIAQDETKARKERLAAVESLQSQYPGYFANLSKEQILTQNLTGVVNELAQALINKEIAQNLAKAAAPQLLALYKLNAVYKQQRKEYTESQQELKRIGYEQGETTQTYKEAEATMWGYYDAMEKTRGEIYKATEVNKRYTESINAINSSASKLLIKEPPKAKAPKKTKVNPNAGNEFTPFLQEFTGAVVPEIALTFKDPTEGFTEWNAKVKLGLTTLEQSWLYTVDNIGMMMEQALEAGIFNIGDAIGNALVNGDNAIQAAGGALLSTLGSFISSVAKEMIEFGILTSAFGAAKEALSKAGISGGVAIAAGIALAVIGSAISASGKKVSSAASGKGGGGTSTSTGSGANNSSTTSGGGYGWSGGGNGTVVFEIAGTSLIGVLNNTTERNLRIGGR